MSSLLGLGFPTSLVLWNFPFRTFFGILSSSILIIWPAHPSLLMLVLSTIFRSYYTVWHTKCHTIDCAHNTFLLFQKHLTSGTELILIGWKIVFWSFLASFGGQKRPENVAQLRAHTVKLCRALSEDLCRKVVTNARVRLQEVVRLNGGHIEHVLH